MNKKTSTSQQRINELLTINGHSQIDMSKRTGIDRSTISLYCNGQRLPRQDKIALIADAYGIDPSWLMGYDVPMINTNTQEPITLIKEYVRSAPQDEIRRLIAYCEGILDMKERS